MHLPVVVWILFCVTSGLLCGRSECSTCSPASDIVEHWSGPTNRDDSYYPCSKHFSNYNTVQSMWLDANNTWTYSDTDIVMTRYMTWLQEGGDNETLECKEAVGRYFCMEVFPPCQSESSYSVYPCREECDYLDSVCLLHRPQSCPLDGPFLNATTPGTGKSLRSNNGLQSCFMNDGSIQPYPFFFASLSFIE